MKLFILFLADCEKKILIYDYIRLVHQFDLASRDISIFISGLHSILSMAVFDGYFYWTQHSGHELFWVKFAK